MIFSKFFGLLRKHLRIAIQIIPCLLSLILNCLAACREIVIHSVLPGAFKLIHRARHRSVQKDITLAGKSGSHSVLCGNGSALGIFVDSLVCICQLISLLYVRRINFRIVVGNCLNRSIRILKLHSVHRDRQIVILSGNLHVVAGSCERLNSTFFIYLVIYALIANLQILNGCRIADKINIQKACKKIVIG